MDTSTQQERDAALAGAVGAQAAISNRRVVLYVDQTMLTERGYRPVMVAEGESGYYEQGDPENLKEPWYFGHDFPTAERLVDEANARLGITPEEARDIVFSSMFPDHRR